MEEEIGNCSLETLIRMLHNGWKVKEIKYKGFNFAGGYGNPCWIVPFYYPEGLLYTHWFRWTPDHNDDMAEMIPIEHGFNTIIFERDE